MTRSHQAAMTTRSLLRIARERRSSEGSSRSTPWCLPQPPSPAGVTERRPPPRPRPPPPPARMRPDDRGYRHPTRASRSATPSRARPRRPRPRPSAARPRPASHPAGEAHRDQPPLPPDPPGPGGRPVRPDRVPAPRGPGRRARQRRHGLDVDPVVAAAAGRVRPVRPVLVHGLPVRLDQRHGPEAHRRQPAGSRVPQEVRDLDHRRLVHRHHLGRPRVRDRRVRPGAPASCCWS